jgi:hypothetical protein
MMLGFGSADSALVVAQPLDETADTNTVFIATMNRSSVATIVDSLLIVGGLINVPSSDDSSFARLVVPWAYRDFALLNEEDGALYVFRQRIPPGAVKPNTRIERVVRPDGQHSVGELEAFTPPLTDAVVAHWMHAVLREPILHILGGRERAEMEIRKRVFKPSYLPVARQVIMGSSSAVYVERVRDDSAHQWDVHSLNGRFRGSFVVRPGIEIQAIRDSTLWAIVRSSTGPESLLVATLRWRSTPR